MALFWPSDQRAGRGVSAPARTKLFHAQLTYMCRVESDLVGDDPSEVRGQSESSGFNLLWNMELIISSNCAKVDF
jgi:hypothetical protein